MRERAGGRNTEVPDSAPLAVKLASSDDSNSEAILPTRPNLRQRKGDADRLGADASAAERAPRAALGAQRRRSPRPPGRQRACAPPTPPRPARAGEPPARPRRSSGPARGPLPGVTRARTRLPGKARDLSGTRRRRGRPACQAAKRSAPGPAP